MSDQQPFQYPNFFGAAGNNRPVETLRMGPPYCPPAVARQENPITQMNTQYPPQFIIRPGNQPSYLYHLAPFLDAHYANSIPNLSPVDCTGHYPQNFNYQHVVSNTPMQLPQVNNATQKCPREKKLLVVKHPDTMSVINLHDDVGVSENSEVAQRQEAPCQTHVKPNRSLIDIPVEPQVSPHIPEKSVSVDNTESTVEVKDQEFAESYRHENESDMTTDEPELFDDEELESDSGDRRRYSPEFIRSCKLAAGRLDFKEYQDLMSTFCFMRRGQTSHEQRNFAHRRIINIPAIISVKRVEGAFVPSKLRTEDTNGGVDALKSLSRKMNIILNRVSEANLSDTVNDLKKLNISGREELHMLAKTVFQKGIRQSKYSHVFANLCKQLKGMEVANSENFSVLILQLTQELFDTPLNVVISELNSVIDAKIAAAKDEAVKRLFEEDRETNILKKTDSYFGNITFIAELYLCQVVPIKTITECLKKLKDSPAPEALPAMIKLLNICGRELDQNARNIVDMCFNRLEQIKKMQNIEAHQMYKVQELIDLRGRNWKSSESIVSRSTVPDNTQRRNTEDKVRRLNALSLDPKRKPAQSVNPLTPSSLAVTQQSHDVRKLGPAIANWSQGSGQLLKPSDEGQLKSNQPGSLTSINHSREASPRITPGLQGAWATPLLATQAKNLKRDYNTMRENTKPVSRTIVELIRAKEDGIDEFIQKCKSDERPALLHNVFELLMDKPSDVRSRAGLNCVALLDNNQLNPSDVITAFERFFETCDEDWLADYPRGWMYIAEILQHFIRENSDYFSVLLKAVEPILSDKRAATVVAHCLQLSSMRIQPQILAAKFSTWQFSWAELGLNANEINDFVNNTCPALALSKSADLSQQSHPKLKELSDLIESKATTEQFSNFFRMLSSNALPKKFIHCCMQVILKSEQSSGKMDQLAFGLQLLVDHTPDRESQVLLGLQEFASDRALVERWLLCLIEKKVISSEALKQWRKKSDGLNEIIGELTFLRSL